MFVPTRWNARTLAVPLALLAGVAARGHRR